MVIQNDAVAKAIARINAAQTGKAGKAAKKLSSGLRINEAADNAAGLAISEKMRAQIRGLSRAQANIEEGVDLLATGDGGMSQICDALDRLEELAVQAANETNVPEDRRAIQAEADEIIQTIDEIAYQTHYNTIPILCGNGNPQYDPKTIVKKIIVPGGDPVQAPADSGASSGGGVGSIVGDATASALGNRVTYGGSGNDSFGNMLFNTDGTAVFCGASASGDQDLTGADAASAGWVCKIGTDGEPLWSVKTRAASTLSSIVRTADGGYFTGGNIGTKCYFAKLDANGALEWDYVTGAYDESVRGMVVNADGDVLVTAQTSSGDAWKDPNGKTFGGPPLGSRDAIVLKIDPMVNPNADFDGAFKKYTAGDGHDYTGLNVGGNSTDQLYKIAPTDDGGFIASGYTLSHFPGGVQVGHGHHDLWVTKFDSDGRPVKRLNYGDNGPFGNGAGGSGNQIIQTDDGGFILVGYSNMAGASGTTPPVATAPNSDNIYIVKMTADLVPEWSQSYGSSGRDSGACIVETADGYIVAGQAAVHNSDVTSDALGGADAWLFKIDKSGSMLWNKTFGGAASDSFQYMYQTSGGDILIAGTSASNDHDLAGKNKGNSDAWFLRISAADGSVVTRPPASAGEPQQRPGSTGDRAYFEFITPVIAPPPYPEVLHLQVGPDTGDAFHLHVADVRVRTLFGPYQLQFDTFAHANESIGRVQSAIQQVTTQRGRFGAYTNALEHLQSGRAASEASLTDAESGIRDADMAKEMMASAKAQILAQASQSMLSQANQQSRSVLQLLQA